MSNSNIEPEPESPEKSHNNVENEEKVPVDRITTEKSMLPMMQEAINRINPKDGITYSQMTIYLSEKLGIAPWEVKAKIKEFLINRPVQRLVHVRNRRFHLQRDSEYKAKLPKLCNARKRPDKVQTYSPRRRRYPAIRCFRKNNNHRCPRRRKNSRFVKKGADKE